LREIRFSITITKRNICVRPIISYITQRGDKRGAAMPRIGIWELLVIVLIILLLFGGGDRLPRMARSIAEAIREFKKEITGKGQKEKKKDEAP